MSKEIDPQSAHQSLLGSAAGRRATWYDSRLRVMEERSDARSMKTSAARGGRVGDGVGPASLSAPNQVLAAFPVPLSLSPSHWIHERMTGSARNRSVINC